MSLRAVEEGWYTVNMRRLLIAIILVLAIYVLAQIVLKEAQTYLHNASLILSGIDQEMLVATIREHFNTDVLPQGKHLADDARFDIQLEYLNSDDAQDVLVTVDSEETCGTGGCLTAFYIKNEQGEFEPINFVSAVKSIQVEPTLTNGMHDIVLNEDFENILRWDGHRYSVNSY